jgi:hypothetical protein
MVMALMTERLLVVLGPDARGGAEARPLGALDLDHTPFVNGDLDHAKSHGLDLLFDEGEPFDVLDGFRVWDDHFYSIVLIDI